LFPAVQNSVGRRSSDAKCGLASVERLAPQFAAVELDQFGSLSSALTFLTSVGRTAQPTLSGSIGVGTGYPVE
jgi:hypothetical protein